MSTPDIPQPRPATTPLLIAAAIVVAEFVTIGLIFKHGIDFDCRLNWGNGACGTASKSLAALYCMAGATALFALLRPELFVALLAKAGHRPRSLYLNLAGFALAVSPALLLQEGGGSAMILPAFVLWGAGMLLILAGILDWLAPPRLWARFLHQSGPALGIVLAAGAITPALAVRLQPVWRLEWITDLTFGAVKWVVEALGYQLYSEPVNKLIGAGDFILAVGQPCSGIEGIALVTIFVSLYLFLFRKELRFPRALLLYPFGILASAALNIVRISVLLVLGLEGHPELAVGGFHSHAGWVMFTLIALGIIAIARRIAWFQRGPVRQTAPQELPALRQDPVAARILPFAVFMLTAAVLPALSQTPAILYPARVILVGLALLMVWPGLQGLRWRVSPLAWAAGVAIGLMWISIPVAAADGPPPYGTLSGGLLVIWFLFRGIGTVLLVPLIEELFFRDYLEGKLCGPAPAALPRRMFAALITASLFAMLHDRWVEALIAGLIFSFLAQRRGRISDAIAAHALANLVVFGAAVLTGNLAII